LADARRLQALVLALSFPAASALGAEARVTGVVERSDAGEQATLDDEGANWPMPNVPHQAVVSMRESDLVSPAAVARYFRRHVAEERERVKALHDFVVSRLSYEETRRGASGIAQDPAAVFARGTANCEGYARLLAKLIQLAGGHSEIVRGRLLEDGAKRLAGHAWNAVRLGSSWVLIDATLDDPLGEGDAPQAGYRTDYLFIPPDVAALDHFPDDSKWRLGAKPVSIAEARSALAPRPSLVREGLVVRTPRTPHVPRDEPVEVVIDNPLGRFILATLDGERCGLSNARRIVLRCANTGQGSSRRLMLLANGSATGLFLSVASFDLEVK
jgi:hypothetical protein